MHGELTIGKADTDKKYTGCRSTVYRIIAGGLEKFFAIFYFYFTPFAIMIIPYLYKYFYPHHDTGSSAGGH